MADPRVEALAGMVGRVEGASCWLARLATRAAMVGGVAGALLWWVVAGDRVDEWWQGTVGSVVVLVVCVGPAAWLLNVRFALHELVELPDKLSGVATRRVAQIRRDRAMEDRPAGGVLSTVRSVRDVVRDYGDVVGSWGTVAQLVAPLFWLLTVGSLLAVPVIVLLAGVAGLLNS